MTVQVTEKCNTAHNIRLFLSGYKMIKTVIDPADAVRQPGTEIPLDIRKYLTLAVRCIYSVE